MWILTSRSLLTRLTLHTTLAPSLSKHTPLNLRSLTHPPLLPLNFCNICWHHLVPTWHHLALLLSVSYLCPGWQRRWFYAFWHFHDWWDVPFIMDVQPIDSSTENKESFGLRQTWVKSQLHCWLASSFPWSPYPTCHQALSVLLLKYIFNLVTSLPLTVTVSIHTTITHLNQENSLMTSLLVSVLAPYLPFPMLHQSYLSL